MCKNYQNVQQLESLFKTAKVKLYPFFEWPIEEAVRTGTILI